MRTGRIEKRTVLFVLVMLSAVSLILASQNASAAVVHQKVVVDHKAHTASKSSTSIGVHDKLIAVIPETLVSLS